ncbi:hypothetical protein Nepgr_011986 [Nepenthes gracilis]|uniref:Uncharacterized protein n=1 Tax=Nepenthes gracilis TaxID=150966 RepID=A0AAD3SF19_NEPGR|nr:hypothetical protein Nepgr_011986 [Nepenthes gracilis]
MAHQEDGWPLGLKRLNVRIGLLRNRELSSSSTSSGSASFSTLLTASPTSSCPTFSDTQATGSFFKDNRSITLGSLTGISSIVQLSRLSTHGRRPESTKGKSKAKKNSQKKTCLYSFCSRLSSDDHARSNETPSLGSSFPEEERAC